MMPKMCFGLVYPDSELHSELLLRRPDRESSGPLTGEDSSN